jgi:hypothetical protein
MTEYRIHVKGKIEGRPHEIHTYKCSQRPESIEEARKIAEDFEEIEELVTEEVTTITKSRIIDLR